VPEIIAQHMPVVDHPDSKVRDQPAPNFGDPAADEDELAVIMTPSNPTGWEQIILEKRR
jgi:hypothetical protein